MSSPAARPAPLAPPAARASRLCLSHTRRGAHPARRDRSILPHGFAGAAVRQTALFLQFVEAHPLREPPFEQLAQVKQHTGASCRSPSWTRLRASPSNTIFRCAACLVQQALRRAAWALGRAAKLPPALRAPQVSDIKRSNGLLSDTAMFAKDTLLIPTRAMPPIGHAPCAAPSAPQKLFHYYWPGYCSEVTPLRMTGRQLSLQSGPCAGWNTLRGRA